MSGYFFGNLSGEDDDSESNSPSQDCNNESSSRQVSFIADNKHDTSNENKDQNKKKYNVQVKNGSETSDTGESSLVSDEKDSESTQSNQKSPQHSRQEQQINNPHTQRDSTSTPSQPRNHFAVKHRSTGHENDDVVPLEICSKRLSLLNDNNVKIHQELNERRHQLLKSLCNAIYRGRLLTLNLSYCDLSHNESTIISSAMKCNPNLSVLRLSGNNFGNEGIMIISKAIRIDGGNHHSKLSMLDLGFNNISDIGCIALVIHAISRNYNLKSLFLSGNLIGDKGAMALASVIVSGCGLEKLHLAVNKIGPNGATALTRAVAESDAKCRYLRGGGDPSRIAMNPSDITMQFSAINELVLGYNSFGASGSLSVSNMILTNSSLRVLCMCNNDLGDRELALLSQALARNKTVPLEAIKLSFNLFSCVGVESLMNAVWGSKTLRELKLDHNRIADRGAQLAAVLLGSVQLQTLDLGFNRIGAVGIKALMKSLSENTVLQHLSLSGNPLDTLSSKALSYALAYNTSLRKLYLDKCQISYVGQRHVAAGIVSNGYLKLEEVTGIQLAPISVTLGFPRECEYWDNDTILFFVRAMWEQDNNERNMEMKRDSSNEEMTDAVVSNRTKSNNKNEQPLNQNIQRSGPRSPDIVVAVAKKAFSTEEGVDAITNSLRCCFAKAKKADYFSPNKPLIIEQSISGSILTHSSVDDQSQNYDTNLKASNGNSESKKTSQIGESVEKENSQNPSFIDECGKPLEFDYLQHLVSILREISNAAFVEDDFNIMWQYFFTTGAIQTDTLSRKSFSEASLRNTRKNPRQKYSETSLRKAGMHSRLKSQTDINSHRNRHNQTFNIEQEHSMQHSGDRHNQTFDIEQEHSIQNNVGKRRSLSFLNPDSTQVPTLKRMRSSSMNDHIDIYPRVKQLIQTKKISKHEMLIMFRRIKFMESFKLYKSSQGKSIHLSQRYEETLSPSDIETILLDLIK